VKGIRSLLAEQRITPPQSPVVPGAAPVPGVAKSKSKISLPVLIVLGLVFIIVWGLFWAIIFGFIKR